jgi:GT2 family glycosyltransferase
VQGEFTAFLGEREQLGVDNFYEIVKRLNRNPAIDLFYWDEDRIDSQGQRTKPFFRPDWSPILLLSMNYIGECFVLRTALARNLERTSLSSAPSRNYDLALRAVERTDRIVHIPEVLSHRREGAISSPDDDGAAAERDRENARAIDAALRRRGEAGRVEITGPGLYAARYDIRDQPLVSILIPTRDKCQLLRQCLESIERNTDYKNYQIIVLDNDSSEPETFAYFEQISRKVEIHRYRGQFNFSAINNYGAAESKGEFLLFLNNDTQVIRADWMRALIEQAQRPEVGAVGAKLLFADGRIQHAGAVLGIGGLVGHAFRLTSGNQPHYFGLSDVIRDCSAVTAACMMMRRSVFDEVEGYDEKLQVDFADIDLCLRLRRRRYRIVYTPLSLLYHYESVTRRRMHVASDYDIFIKRWGHCLRTPDPHYGRNLTLEREDWTIAP